MPVAHSQVRRKMRDVDRVFKTCCALHNQLLHMDGLDARWGDGIPSHWQGEEGDFDEEDLPLVFRRMSGVTPTTDTSGMGTGRSGSRGPDAQEDDEDAEVDDNHAQTD